MLKFMGNVLAMAFMLIGIFLFVSNADGTARVINSFSGLFANSFKTLQGR